MYLRPALAALSLLLAVACVGGDGPPTPPAGADSAAATDVGASQTADSEEPPPSEDGATTGKPDADVEGRCTREPQAGEGGEELVADLRVVNTGNLGVVVRVASRWPVGPDGGVIRWTRVRVEQGKTKRVSLTLPVDAALADGVRDAVERGRRCHVRRRITGAFGIPEE